MKLRAWTPPPPPPNPPVIVLSPRRAQVLSGLCCGLTLAQIGAGLYITEDTVKTHVRALYRTLRVHRSVHAVALVMGGHVQVMIRDEAGRAA